MKHLDQEAQRIAEAMRELHIWPKGAATVRLVPQWPVLRLHPTTVGRLRMNYVLMATPTSKVAESDWHVPFHVVEAIEAFDKACRAL